VHRLVVERLEDVAPTVASLGVDAPRATAVVVGGAAGLGRDAEHVLAPLAAAIVRAAARCGAVVVDGGTDAGIMRLVGRARSSTATDVPLVGVIVQSLAALPGDDVVEPKAAVEPGHSHLVLVPGSTWGDEAPWIARIAGAIAGDRRSVTVLVNGGEIAWTDVAESVAAGRRVLTVAGTGRTADALADAIAGETDDERAAALARSGLVESVGPGSLVADELGRRIEQVLMATAPDDAR
jgi:SLOG in TRPM, prokaryote